MKVSASFEIETGLFSQNQDLIIAGTDEAGRGPLCGPVVAAAVIFPSYEMSIPVKITDSKQLSASKRMAAYDWITQNTIWAIGICEADEIDEINILNASMLAMTRAVENLSIVPDFCLVDGNRMPNGMVGRAVVKGDGKSISIAAASILAKQTRDKIMCDLAEKFPEYGWDKNMGYPTKSHLCAISTYGINNHYRKTFKPIKDLL